MYFKPAFFYNADATDNGGGADTATVEATQQAGTETAQESASQTDTSAVEKMDLPEEVVAKLKEYEELKRYKEENSKPKPTDAELQKAQEEDRANFINYSVKNDLLKLDDLTKYETLKTQKDADLVFESFFKSYREENPEITDEKELAEAAKEEFDNEYKLSSKNEKAKERGLARLAKDASEIRSPYESKIKAAEVSYKDNKAIADALPEFDKFVKSEIAKHTPDKIPFKIKSGEENVVVEIELTAKDKEIIAKEFSSHKTFFKYRTDGADTTAKSIEKKVNGWIKANKFEEAINKAAQIFEGIGVKKGSNVGAENLFALQSQQSNKVSDNNTQSNQEANKAAEKARNNRR